MLDGNPSTQPEKGVVVRTDGKPLRYPDGRPVLFAADSIALSSDGAWLYWKALTGTTLLVDGGQHLMPSQRDVMFLTEPNNSTK